MYKYILLGQDIDEYLKCPYRLGKSKNEEGKSFDYLNSESFKAHIKDGLEYEGKVLLGLEWGRTEKSLNQLFEVKTNNNSSELY